MNHARDRVDGLIKIFGGVGFVDLEIHAGAQNFFGVGTEAAGIIAGGEGLCAAREGGMSLE